MARIIDSATIDHKSTFDKSTTEWIYNGLDCTVTREVHDELSRVDDNISTSTYRQGMELQAPIIDMGLRGVRVDLKRRSEVLEKYQKEKDHLYARLERIMKEGVGFDLPSLHYTHLLKFFYEVLRLKPIKKRNSKGIMAPTVNRDALEKLQTYKNAEVFCKYILAIRDLGKKIGFLKTEIDDDNRIRCNFNVAGTDTGRLASSMSEYGTGTNLQNVDKNLRECFIADKGYRFCNIDLEQADSRNVGALIYDLFGDSAYLDACESGDLHTTVCRMAWPDLEWGDDPTKWRAVADQIGYRDMSYRDLAKRLGHGTNYYGTPRTMAKHTKVSTSMIQTFQDRYYGKKYILGTDRESGIEQFKVTGGAFPYLHHWHQWCKNQLLHGATITTLFGRRRSFFGRIPDDSTLRKAIAYCGQSATADEMNLGLINLYKFLPEAELLIQVHDSILFQYKAELEDEIVPKALDLLKVTIDIGKDNRPFTVPLEAQVGWNWGPRKDWTKFDFEKGKCKREQIGTCKENPNGLIDWDPNKSDTRERKKSIWLPKKKKLVA